MQWNRDFYSLCRRGYCRNGFNWAIVIITSTNDDWFVRNDGEIMKISYTVYDANDNIVLGGVCDFLDLADIQWQAFDNGHAVFTEKMDDE